MRPEQPPTQEGEYLMYLLKVSEDGAMPAMRLMMPGGAHWDVTWMERQERAACYALGRVRESLCHRVKRLTPEQAEQTAFLRRLLAHSQGEDGGKVTAPRWPAQALGTVRGMVRDRLTSTRSAA